MIHHGNFDYCTVTIPGVRYVIAMELRVQYIESRASCGRRVAVLLVLLFLGVPGAYPQSTLVFPQLVEGPGGFCGNHHY